MLKTIFFIALEWIVCAFIVILLAKIFVFTHNYIFECKPKENIYAEKVNTYLILCDNRNSQSNSNIRVYDKPSMP